MYCTRFPLMTSCEWEPFRRMTDFSCGEETMFCKLGFLRISTTVGTGKFCCGCCCLLRRTLEIYCAKRWSKVSPSMAYREIWLGTGAFDKEPTKEDVKFSGSGVLVVSVVKLIDVVTSPVFVGSLATWPTVAQRQPWNQQVEKSKNANLATETEPKDGMVNWKRHMIASGDAY